MADDVVELIKTTLEVAEADLMGYSMGAGIAASGLTHFAATVSDGPCSGSGAIHLLTGGRQMPSQFEASDPATVDRRPAARAFRVSERRRRPPRSRRHPRSNCAHWDPAKLATA